MRKRVLIGLGVSVVLLAIFVFAAGYFLAPFFALQPRVEFEEPGILVIDLHGTVVERMPPDLFAAELMGAEQELLDIALALDRAAQDDRIAGVYVRVGWPGYGWAKAEEIRSRLARFRESGKFVHAYTALTNELGYYVALASDRIYLLPDAGMELNGFRVETPFIRGALEKLGIAPQVEAIGVYKSAADFFRRDDMSDPDREMTREILEQMYERFVGTVVETRGVERARFVEAFDQGIYLGRDLEALGLIDGERYETDVLDEALALALEIDPEDVEAADVESHLIDVRDYARDLPDPPGKVQGTVALVYATGAITGGESGFDPVFGQTMGSKTMVRMLREVAADEAIDAAVIRVDSPGGDALASEEIWDAVVKLVEKVPVVVSMSDVAASGGYYISAGADSIVAEASTITGSIGIFGILFDMSGMWDKLGVSWDSERTNPGADFPTFTRPLNEAERETFRRLIEHGYASFLQRVAEGRAMGMPEVEEVAQGRVWTGRSASERNLVDSLGGLETALEMAKSMAGIEPEARVRLHVYPGRPSFIEQLRQAMRLQLGVGPEPRAGESAAIAAHPLLASPAARARTRDVFRLVPGLGLVLRDGPGRPLAVMPYVVEIR